MTEFHAARRHCLRLATAATLALGLPLGALAQAYPDRPIKLTVPFAAGGGTDVVARILGHHLRTPLGQPIVVDNRPGAGGTVGAQLVAKTAPDGLNLMLTSLAPLTITPNLPGMPLAFDPLKDLAPVALIARQPVLLVASKRSGITRIDELIKAAKGRELTYGTPGNGTELHLIGEMFRQASGARMVHVPYRGGGPAITDLVAGNIDLMVVVTSSILPHLKSGAVQALATTDPRRIPALPDVPTMAEAGFKEVNGLATWGLFGPAGLPAAVQDKLRAALVAVYADAEFRRRMEEAGVDLELSNPAELAAHMRKETEAWKQVIVRGNIKAN